MNFVKKMVKIIKSQAFNLPTLYPRLVIPGTQKKCTQKCHEIHLTKIAYNQNTPTVAIPGARTPLQMRARVCRMAQL